MRENGKVDIQELIANIVLSRGDFFRNLIDPRRDIDQECGFPPISMPVPVELYRELYDREAIANRVVQVMPKECWQKTPKIRSAGGKDSPFDESWQELESNLSSGSTWHKTEEGGTLFEHMQRLDILAGIGHFGVMLLGVDDGKPLQEPIDGVVVFNRKSSGVDEKELRRQVELCRKQPEFGGDRGRVWVLPGTGRLWYEGGDSDERGYFEHVKKRLLTVKGVKAVEFGDESTPPDGEGWEELYPARTYTTNSRTPVMPDCEPTETERAALKAMDEKPILNTKSWNSKSRTYDSTPHTLHYLNTWNRAPRPSSGAIQGTDRAYDQGQSYGGSVFPGMGVSGTDQQYFGVQFGPSEAMAEKPSGERRKLIFVRVFDESLVQVVRWEWNIQNPRFGQPVMYRITLNDPREVHTGVGLPLATVYVHWSRVIHYADNLHSSEVMGIPRMRPVLNNLLGLRKIYSSGPEGWWKSCFTALSLETNPQLGGDVVIDRSTLDPMIAEFQQGLTRVLTLSGLVAKTLPPQLLDPTPHINVQLEAICIQINMPVRVFRGSERGEQASSQDDDNWNGRVAGRQNHQLSPRMLVPITDRFIAIGVLAEPDDDGYSVEWPELESISESVKATIAMTVTQAVAAFVQGQLESHMTFRTFLVEVLKWSEDKADNAIKEAEKLHDEHQDIADEHGFEPAPPPGYKPPPPPLPPPGAVKVKPGEKLVHPPPAPTVNEFLEAMRC